MVDKLSEGFSMPISTKELLDSVGSEGKKAVSSVFKIICKDTNSKGTGFLIKEGVILTNEHVVRGSNKQNIIAVSSLNKEIKFDKIILDTVRDLAVLFPQEEMEGGLEILEDLDIEPGVMVCTWGFPLNYNGPAPLLSTGFLAGFSERLGVKRLVINGAFNNGNSGGPLLKANDSKVLGVVVAKHLPLITPFIASAIEALSKNTSGVVFTWRDNNGNTKQFVESQIVAEILGYYHHMSQVVIGEAIESKELIKFLKDNGLIK